MLRDLANDDGCIALEWAAEDREGWRQGKDVKNLLYSRRLLMMMMMMMMMLMMLSGNQSHCLYYLGLPTSRIFLSSMGPISK